MQRTRVMLDLIDLRTILFGRDADVCQEIEFEIEEIEENSDP